MQPTHAEVARTLAAGHLPASAHIACRQGPFPVRHVADGHGRLLLLSPRDGALAAALRPIARAPTTPPLVLDISDVPPVAGAPVAGPGLGVRLGVGCCTGEEARAAALDYADTDPAADLLDVGDTQVLHRMEVAEVRYERDGALVRRRPRRVRRGHARPAAGHRVRPDRRPGRPPRRRDDRLRAAGSSARPPAGRRQRPRPVVRLDRYGFMVRLGDRLARLAFPRAVRDRHDLAHLLHPVLCHRCGTRYPAA